MWRRRAGLATEGRPVLVQPLRRCAPAPLVGEPLAKPFTLRGLPKPPLGRGGGTASAVTERLYEDRADGSRAVSTKKEDPLSELQLREGVFFLVSQMTSSISTFTIYSICHPPQKSSAVQKVYSFAHPPGTSSLRASSRRAVVSGRSLAASIWPGETW